MMGDPGHVKGPQCLIACQKQHRQNESAGQVDIPARVEVRVMSHCLSKRTQTE